MQFNTYLFILAVFPITVVCYFLLNKINLDLFMKGIRMFNIGLFKKVILADTFAKAVSWGFSNISATTSMDLILVMLSYTFQIYFDFSGYSDMAIGVSDFSLWRMG